MKRYLKIGSLIALILPNVTQAQSVESIIDLPTSNDHKWFLLTGLTQASLWLNVYSLEVLGSPIFCIDPFETFDEYKVNDLLLSGWPLVKEQHPELLGDKSSIGLALVYGLDKSYPC